MVLYPAIQLPLYLFLLRDFLPQADSSRHWITTTMHHQRNVLEAFPEFPSRLHLVQISRCSAPKRLPWNRNYSSGAAAHFPLSALKILGENLQICQHFAPTSISHLNGSGWTNNLRWQTPYCHCCFGGTRNTNEGPAPSFDKMILIIHHPAEIPGKPRTTPRACFVGREVW